MFIFEYTAKNNQHIRALHTGDFRASSYHLTIPSISRVPFDIIYLDTTYLAPSHTFPDQSKVIKAASDLMFKIVCEGKDPRDLLQKSSLVNGKLVTYKNESSFMKMWLKSSTPVPIKNYLILVGSYTIGKERIYIEIANRIKSLLYVESQKKKILECLEWDEVMKLLSNDASKARVHIVPMGQLNADVHSFRSSL